MKKKEKYMYSFVFFLAFLSCASLIYVGVLVERGFFVFPKTVTLDDLNGQKLIFTDRFVSDLVLFWDLSRFSRSGTLYTLQKLKELETKVAL
jgi:hypothetical protein